MDILSQSADFSYVQLSDTESLLTSQYAKVIFHNIEEKYPCDEDLNCQYSSHLDDFVPKTGDRIVLFKLGWQSITDYELFEWAPICEGNCKSTIIFKAENLPRNSYEFYQFCYVNSENSICGASIPFQFEVPDSVAAVEADQWSKIELSDVQTSLTMIEADGPSSPATCAKCVELKQQNENLTHSLQHYDTAMQKYDSDIKHLKYDIELLKRSLTLTQTNVNDFKDRLQEAGEEFKKLYLEKTRIEKKYNKLVKKCQSKKNTENTSTEFDFLDELEPFPAFPFSLKQP